MDHIPDHDEIESNEEPQNSPAVRHQRSDRIRLLLFLGEDGWIVKIELDNKDELNMLLSKEQYDTTKPEACKKFNM